MEKIKRTISVVVPVYNVEEYLSRCIDSILKQTFTDFYLFLVNDGSTDTSAEICDSYKKKEKRIRVIHKDNNGLSSARNVALDTIIYENLSDWITFVDSDDWIHETYLQSLYDAVISDKTLVSAVMYERTNGKSPIVNVNSLQSCILKPDDYFSEFYPCATIACAKLYNSELFRNIRYPLGVIHEDEFVTYRILFSCDNISQINQPLYAYYYNAQSIMGKQWNPNRLIGIEAYKEQLLFFKNNHYEKSYISIVKWCMALCAECLMNMYQNPQKYKNEIKKTRRYLRKLLWEHREVYCFKSSRWFYDMAYPKQMEWHDFISKRLT